MITAMNEIVQNPDVVGTAMKTLTMYLRAAKTEAEDAGIETDGMANSVAELRSEIMRLTGVDIMLDDDNFKSTFQILKEISQVWDQITDVSRANVLELLGGKRGANSVSALITNFQTAIDAAETAAGSAGSALRENEKYLDSIEGKISILQSNFESLSAGIIDSGVVKFLLDVVNGLMSVLNTLNKVHLLLPAIAGFVTYFAGKKMVGGLGGIAAEISQLAKGASSTSAIAGAISGSLTSLNSRQLALLSSIISVKAETLGLNAAQKEQILQTIAATTATQGLTTANKGLGSALKLVWKANPIGIIITAITTAISAVTYFTGRASQASAEAIENANEIIEKYEEAERTYKSNIDTIDSVSDRFNELAKGVGENGENVSLTNSEYEEFKSLLKQIVDISPAVVTGYNNEGTAIANYTDLVSKAIDEQEKFIENQRNIKLGSGEELYKGWKAEYKNAAEEAESTAGGILDAVYSSAEHFEFAPGSKRLDSFKDKLPELFGMSDEEFISMDDLRSNIDAISALYENRDEFLFELRNALKEETDEDGNPVYDDDYIDKHIAAIDTAILSSTGALQKLEASKEALADYFADWVDYQKESGYSGMEWASSIPDDAFDEFQDGIASVVDFSKSFEENRDAVIEYGRAFSDAAVSDQVKNIVEMSKRLAENKITLEDYNKAVNDFSNGFEGDPIVGEMITAWLRSLVEVPQKAEEAAGGIQKAYSTLKDAVEDIKDLDSYYDDAKSGKMSIVDALEAAYKLAEDFGGEPLDYLTDGFMLDAEAIENLRVEVANATADLFGLEGAERSAFLDSVLNAEALEDEATAYEKLSDAISKSNSVLGIREDITDGDMDFSDIIDAANKIAEDTGKSITDFIDTDTWTLKVGAIRDAYEELVKAEAAVLDISEDAKKSYIQNRLAEFDNAAKIEKEAKAYDKLKDSVSDVSKLQSYLTNAKEGKLGIVDSIEAAAEMAEKYGGEIKDYLTEDNLLDMDKVVNARRRLALELARLSGARGADRNEVAKSIIADLENADAVDQETKAYEELSKAIDNANKIASIRQDFAEGDMGFIDMLDAATQLAEITEKPITDFFDISTLTLNVGALDEAYEQFIQSMIAGAGITGEAADKALQLSMEQYRLAKATEETAKSYDKLHDSISNISELQSYISDASSGEMGFTKSIEAAAKMAEKYGGEIRDYLNADKLLDMDKVNAALQKEAKILASAAANSRPEYIETYKQILAEMQKEIAGDTEAFGELSTAISNVGDALSYIEKAASGDMDFTESLEAAIKLAQLTESDSPLQFLNTSDWTLNKDALKNVYDTYVNEMIDAIATNEEERESLRASAEAAYEKSQAVEKVSSAYDKMSNAIGMAGSVSTFLTDVNSGEKTVVEQIEQAISLAEALKDADGNIPDWTEWITSVSDAGDVITWNTEAIRALSDSYIDAAFAGTEFADKNPILIQQIKDSAAAAAEAKNAMEALTNESEKYKNAIEASKNNGGYIQLTADAYKSLTDIDSRYISAIEYQNGILTMNSDRMDEVTASILEETKARAEEQRQLILNSEEYKKLMDLYQRGMLTDPNQAKRLQSLIVEANGYDVLAHEIEAASSAYSKWLNRGTEIDRFDEAKNAFDLINETLNDKESDIFGQIGSRDFSLAVDFVLGEHVEVDTPEFERAFGIAKKYLSDEAQGAANFYDDLLSAGLIDANGYLNTTIEEIAGKLQISTDLVRTMIDSVNKYQTEDNKIKVTEADTEDSEQSIEELKQVIDDLNQQINDLNTNDIDLNLGESSGDTQEKLGLIDGVLESIKTCIAAIADSPLNIDLSSMGGAIDELKKKFSEFKEWISGSGASAEAGDMSGVIANADIARAKLTEIKSLLDSISSAITNMNAQRMQLNMGNIGLVSSTLSKIISQISALKANKTITIRINEITTKSTINRKSNNLASAWGSSRAVGGRTLVGELGMETVVDPARGIWYTVGEHGAEFVNLPENAIVFNHLQTRQLFSDGNTDSRGEALASGTAAVDLRAKSIYGEKVSGTPKRPTASTTSNKNKKKKKKKSSGSKSSSSSSDDKSALDAILEKYQELNDQLEHLIAHQEFLFDQAENGLDYKGMDDSLIEQTRLYREIMSNAQAGINELIAAGAKDTDKQLQTIEETYWDAYRSLYDTLDKINALFVDGLNDKIDGIQKAYKSLKDAAEEYSEYGGITVDTFQSLVDNGVQYLSLLKNANGQYVINKDSIDRLIMAEKEQLAIESALSYINQINTALGEKQAEAVANLTDLTNKISNSTWDAVYAQAALLKGAGLTEEQYRQVIANIDALHALANEVISDTSSKAEKSRSEAAKDTKSALEEILDLTKDLIKYEADEQKKAIEDQIEAYKKIIDLKKESLQTSKDENAYAKNVAEKTKEIADLQVKIDKLSLDDSREAYAQRASLIEDLKKAQEELADLQGDHSYDAQIDALDKMAEQYEEEKNAEIEAIEKSLSSEEKLYQAAMKRLESGWADIYEQLIAWNTEAGSSLNNEITENWNKAAEAVKRYGSFVKAMDGISGKENDSGSSDANSGNNDIVANGTGTDMSKYEKAAEDAGKANSAGDATDATKDDANQAAKTFVKIVRGQWYIRSGAGKKYSEYGIARNGEVFEYAGKKSGNWVAVNYKGKTGWIYNTGLTMYDEVPKYHAGGIVKKTSDGDEVLALLQSGEMVLDEKKKGALYKIIDFQKELSDRLGTAIGNIGKPLANLLNVGAISKIGANGYAASAAGGIIFNPVINVDISAGGSMSDGDAARFGNRIADIAIERLYEGFNKRGIGNIMSNTMNGRK